MPQTGRSWWGVLLALGVWFLLDLSGLTNALFLPPLQNVIGELWKCLLSTVFWKDLILTVTRAGTGLALAVIIGIPLGLTLGISPTLYRTFALPLDFLRSIPSAALFPLFIVALGVGDRAKIAVVTFGCVFVVTMGALYGARGSGDRVTRETSLRTMGASDRQILWLVVLPEAFLNVIASLRIAVSFAFVLAVVTEMFLGSDDGIGRRILDSYLAFQIGRMYAYLIVLGLLGNAANVGVERLEVAVLRDRL